MKNNLKNFLIFTSIFFIVSAIFEFKNLLEIENIFKLLARSIIAGGIFHFIYGKKIETNLIEI